MRTVAVFVACGASLPGARQVARADGMVVVGGSPRSIGRAGADDVGDDGAGALLVDPAAMARRSDARAQVGVAFIDDDLAWRPDDKTAAIAHGQAGSIAMPMVGLEIPVGDWILGAGAMTAAASDRELSQPNVPPAAFGNQFAYRYAGLGGSIRRDTITAGAARRITDEIAIGVSAGASRVIVDETRAIWAGFSGIHPPGDPSDDVTLALAGEDHFVPSVVAGMLFAPNDTSLELAISVAWSAPARLSGDVATATAGTGPSVLAGRATDRLDLQEPWTIRAGGRYAGERWIAELDGDLWVFPSLAYDNVWTVTGLNVESSTVTANIPSVQSRLAPRTHGAVRAALDVALIPGFLWATGGYAYTTRGTSEARLSPTFADLGGHTGALGLEANAGGFTLTLGVSRTWTYAYRPGTSAYDLDNPFAAGDASVPTGTYSGTIDQVGLMIDGELGSSK